MSTIVVDENIPYATEAFGRYGDVRLLPGRSIRREDLAGADVLLVRSVTRVDRALLEGTPVAFVGTATIGTDHIDLGYLRRAGIAFADAAGCNSRSVAEYVIATVLELRTRDGWNPAERRIGVVGLGRIGGIVAPMLRALGAETVEYDPPRHERESEFMSADLEDLFGCDLLTFHVPLIGDGAWTTRGMVDRRFLSRLGTGTIIVNASRGGVVDSGALTNAMESGRVRAALDVWAGEPDVPPELIGRCEIATPHIAGYSLDGKLRGAEMISEALGQFFSRSDSWRRRDVLPSQAGQIEIPVGLTPLDAATLAVRAAYDVRRDDADLRTLLTADADGRRKGFDALRKNYRARREFPAYVVRCDDPATKHLLGSLGFSS